MLLSILFKRNPFAFSQFSDTPVVHPNNWNIIFMLVLLMLLAAIVATSRGKIVQTVKAFVVTRYFSLLQRDGKIMEQRVFRFMLVFDVATFALGVTTLLEIYKPDIISRYTYPGCFGIAFAVLFLLYFLKELLQNLYIYLFDHQKEKAIFHQHKFVFLTVGALCLYLALALVVFTNWMLAIHVYLIAFLILVCIYFYNSYKINSRNFNLFHFFIYFCTLEILPYLILVKLVVTV